MEGSAAAVPARPPEAARVGLVEPEADKGLKANALGLISSVVIGVASTAPAYSLAATLGFVVGVAGIGLKSPFIMMVSFVPMLLIASSYYYLNKVDPDCGTTFTWVTRAMGPQTGWVTGFVMVAADVIVMASLAQIAGSYFYLLIGANGLATSTFWTTGLGVLFIVAMTAICVLGIEISARVQWFMLGAEVIILTVFSIVALTKVYVSHPVGAIRPALSWFTPTHLSLGALAGGVLLALFIYWGWDTTVSVNEETQNKHRTPGVAAVLSTIALVLIYVVVTTAAQAYHGTGFLVNNSNDVLSPLGTGVFGSPWDKLLILAVLSSSVASTLTTILPGARTTLSMAVHGAWPRIFGVVNPRTQTPLWSTIIFGIASVAWYVGLTIFSQNVLYDSIAALGLTIAFYYGITGYAVPIFYRHQLGRSWRSVFMLAIFPLLGAAMLTWVFAAALDELYYPANSSSGTSWRGIGPPFFLGLGTFAVGVIGMLIAWPIAHRYFSRHTETVETMTETPSATVIGEGAKITQVPPAA